MRTKNAFYNIISSLVLELVYVLFGFIIPIIYIKNYGSNAYGLITSITEFLGYISLLESGVGPVLKTALYGPISKKNKPEIEGLLCGANSFFNKITIIFIAYILMLCVFNQNIFGSSFSSVLTISLIVIISLSKIFEYLLGMTYRIYLQANQKSYIVSIVQIITYIIVICLTIIMVKLKFDLLMVKLITSVLFIIKPIILKIIVEKKFNIKYSRQTSKINLKNKWDGMGQHVAWVVNSKTDYIILTFFSTLVNIAIYNVYSLVTTGVQSMIRCFSNGIDAAFGNMIAKKENEKLIKNFTNYEIVYHSVATIAFICTLLLINPFISIYTKNISDANYLNIKFGVISSIVGFIYILRAPYLNLIYSSNHFKQMNKICWLESFINLALSIVLVIKIGLIGVIIATLVATTIRTSYSIVYANKKLLCKKRISDYKIFFIDLIELVTCVVIFYNFIYFKAVTYFNWLFIALIVAVSSSIIVLGINSIVYQKNIHEIFSVFRKVIKHERKVN